MTAPVGLPEALGQLLPPERQATLERAGDRGTTPFAERLESVVQEADAAQRTAETMATDFADGRQNDIHGTMVALQQADIQLRFVANVRNRLIEAYREIMRMGA
jgi:flagellar hook-basal body complex protein FliE